MAVNLEVLIDQPQRARVERDILEALARNGEDRCFLTGGEKNRLVALKLSGRRSSAEPR